MSEASQLERVATPSADPVPDSVPVMQYPLAPERLSAPAGTFAPVRLRRAYAGGILVIHVLSLLAFLPYFFSWTGVVLVFVGHHLFGMLGMTLGYHRLLTHRGFTCPKWFEHTLAVLGVCNLQDTPARWVAVHRQHHQHSDEQPDPHSPLVSVIWSHMGWLLVENREHNTIAFYDRYVKDLLRDPFYMFLERRYMWAWVYAVHAAVFFAIGLAIGWATTGSYWSGVQYGSSWLVWGVFVRTVFVWHGTWAVNSLSHAWGYKNYTTGDNSRNNWLVAMMSHGEGWHNNHHAEPRAAAHGHRWWEFDLTWMTIKLFQSLGLVKNIVRPKAWGKVRNA